MPPLLPNQPPFVIEFFFNSLAKSTPARKLGHVSWVLLLSCFFNLFATSVLAVHYQQLNDYRNPAVTASAHPSEEIYLSPLGITVGIKVNTDGIMVVGTTPVQGADGQEHHPAERIQVGDTLVFANNQRLQTKEDLTQLVKTTDKITLVLKRDNQLINLELTPIADSHGQNKLGLWVKDMAQGIGTVTYYNPVSGKFGALGHGIMDSNTKDLLSIDSGAITLTHIENIKKGKKGSPGELVGYSGKPSGTGAGNTFGSIDINTQYGIFGYLNAQMLEHHKPIPIGRAHTIKTGEAMVLSNIEGSVQAYTASIESVNKNTTDNSKGMVVKITDQDLIERTNGIVQGMSGSPIIQNGRLIGAVTHVFVQDPTKGYGVFIEHMLKQESGV